MSIKRDTIYNLGGSIAPMFVSLVAVPIYLHLIGDARYGVLAIVWLFVGYFGILDPGVGRAAEYHIARLNDSSEQKERESVFWTAFAINMSFGLLAGAVLYLIARPIFMMAFKMPSSMKAEVMASLPWLAASLPVSMFGGMLIGALQARGRFGICSSISVGNSIVVQLAPLAVAYWHGPELTWLIPTVLIARSLGIIPSAIVVVRALPLGVGGRFDLRLLKTLFSYGGWVSITNVLTPILSSLDRMIIGSLVSAAAVAFYTVPFNLASKVLILPGALTRSLFPRLSRSGKEGGTNLASEAVTALTALTTPLIILAIGVLPIFMRFWVGRSFAEQSAPIGIVLFVGVWVNGLAFVPYAHLQASNRPDVVAKFHAIELLPFLGILWLGLHYFGLIGAAYAWTLRVCVDAVLLFIVGGTIPNWRKLIPGGVFLILAAFCSPTVILSTRTFLELALLTIATLWAWNLSPEVRSAVHRWAGAIRIRTTA